MILTNDRRCHRVDDDDNVDDEQPGMWHLDIETPPPRPTVVVRVPI